MSELNESLKQKIFPCLVKALVDSGDEDPNVHLFWGVLTNNISVVEKSIKDGANVNGTDTALIKEHLNNLTSGKASTYLAENILTLFFSLKQNIPNNTDNSIKKNA